MLSILPQLPHVCEVCIPPPSHHPFVGPHTESLSWHCNHACCQMSSPYASAGPAQRCLYLCPVCRPIYPGNHGDWRRCGGAYWPHHTAQERHLHQNARACMSPPPPGLVDLKISISSLAGASCFLSLLPVWPLHLHQWPAVSLAVEYPSESGTPLSGEEGGKPPPSTVVHWILGSLP